MRAQPTVEAPRSLKEPAVEHSWRRHLTDSRKMPTEEATHVSAPAMPDDRAVLNDDIAVFMAQARLLNIAAFPQQYSAAELAEISTKVTAAMSLLSIRLMEPKESHSDVYWARVYELSGEIHSLSTAVHEAVRIVNSPPTPTPVSPSPAHEKSVPAKSIKRSGDKVSAPADKAAKSNSGFKKVPSRLTFKSKNVDKESSIPITINQPDVPVDVDPDAIHAMDTATATEKKAKKPPPIFIVPSTDWFLKLPEIRNVVAPSLYSVMKGRFLRLTTSCADEYRALRDFLWKNKIENKTYLLDEERPFKVVLRGLPACTSNVIIKDHLERLGFHDVKVTPMLKGPKARRVPMPLFHVSVAKTETVQEIYNITELLGTEVHFEKFRGNKGPSQCFNCQGFFHSAIACRLAPRCVRCGEGHSTGSELCKKAPQDPCTCANCGGDHPANYRRCPKFPVIGRKKRLAAAPVQLANKQQKPSPTFASKVVEPGLSYAAAASRTKEAPRQIPAKSSVPSSEDSSDTDFLKLLITLEANYDRKLILAAFSAVLPALRAASHPMDRFFLLYESVVTLSQ